MKCSMCGMNTPKHMQVKFTEVEYLNEQVFLALNDIVCKKCYVLFKIMRLLQRNG